MGRSNIYSNGGTHLSPQPSYKSKLKKKITSTLAGILKVGKYGWQNLSHCATGSIAVLL